MNLTFEQHRALANLRQALKFADGNQRRAMAQQLRVIADAASAAQVGDLVAALSSPTLRNLPLRFETGDSPRQAELEDVVLCEKHVSLIIK